MLQGNFTLYHFFVLTLFTLLNVFCDFKMMAETLREVVTIFSWESVHTLEGSLVNELKQKLFFIEALVAEAK